MSDLNAQFEQAQQDVQGLSARPSNSDMQSLYGLYKQATAGDVTGKRPGMMDIMGRGKYDGWSKQKGKSSDVAKQEYVDLVGRLKG